MQFPRFPFAIRSVLLGTTALLLALSPVACDRDKTQHQAERLQQKSLANIVHKVGKATGVDVSMLTFWPPSSAGNYLAARVAISNDDLPSANASFQQAIEASTDPAIRAYISERALPVAIGTGDLPTALRLTEGMTDLQQSATGQFAVMLRLREAMAAKDWTKVTALTEQIRGDGFGQFIKPLTQAWGLAGQGKQDLALTVMDQAVAKNPSLRGLFTMHRALILEMAGREPEAEKLYRDTLNSSFTLGGALIAADYFARHNQTDELKNIYRLLQAKLSLPVTEANFIASFPFRDKQQDAVHGYALSLFDLATVLHSENSSRLALLYARIAEPELKAYPTLQILLGDIFSSMHDYTEARAAYDAIKPDTLFYATAQWNIADTYILENNTDAALKALEPLTTDPALKRQTLTQQADLLRADKQYDRAVKLYTEVIDDLTKKTNSGNDKPLAGGKGDWGVYYARAICYESLKEWDKSEADLQTALTLSPEQSEVLNYLGYSWADKGIKLEQAYDYIGRAHGQTPDDPYITDSAGWVLYQMGHFNEAVEFLEQSVQQLPADATINDHLGDAYWQVGREVEARFQWERALKNNDEADDDSNAKIRDKLKAGLPKKEAHNGPLPELKITPRDTDSLNSLLQRLKAPISGMSRPEQAKPEEPAPAPAKAPAKTQVKAPAKVPSKTLSKAPAKTLSKTPAKK